MKLFIFLLGMLLGVSSYSDAEILDLNTQGSTWKSQGSSAYISIKGILPDGSFNNFNFIVAFNKDNICKGEFAFSAVSGNNYGKLIGTEKFDAGVLKLYVDDKPIFYDVSVGMIYNNGREVGSIIKGGMLESLENGNTLKVELFGNFFLFGLKNSAAAIESAKSECSF